MTITVTGDVELDDIKEIVKDELDSIHDLTIFVPYESFGRLLLHPDVIKGLAYMLPRDVEDGNITLYGASIKCYFPQILEEN